jgi:hypothetical protein
MLVERQFRVQAYILLFDYSPSFVVVVVVEQKKRERENKKIIIIVF